MPLAPPSLPLPLSPVAPPAEERELPEPDPVLLEAARLLREGWTQGLYRKSPPLYLRLLGAKPRYCLVGAVAEAVGMTIGFPAYLPPSTLPYIKALGFRHPNDALHWNDASNRKKEEVVELVERAAYGL